MTISSELTKTPDPLALGARPRRWRFRRRCLIGAPPLSGTTCCVVQDFRNWLTEAVGSKGSEARTWSSSPRATVGGSH